MFLSFKVDLYASIYGRRLCASLEGLNSSLVQSAGESWSCKVLQKVVHVGLKGRNRGNIQTQKTSVEYGSWQNSQNMCRHAPKTALLDDADLYIYHSTLNECTTASQAWRPSISARAIRIFWPSAFTMAPSAFTTFEMILTLQLSTVCKFQGRIVSQKRWKLRLERKWKTSSHTHTFRRLNCST